ncbi:muscarinic acetylcholine receptor M3-like [Megalops cyprinoides]|uniref:muscarinic acetylcholine receptor M3-like n=1 Tax=Megalops cyprinoides TaxID=118141 RepID=UPI00186478D0|nr:muscarinic acetylcholine receptor M3-like [Megalops cyprinoides]
MNFSCESQVSNWTVDPLGGHKLWEVVLIILITGPLSLVTIIGNLLVMISFRVNSHLRTVNNYFLLSLAVADLVLGAISMNLYTTYIIMGRWALGNLACDIWLAIDYVASNASVMNLLVISFDRFFSVTRPLTYRAKRTPRRAAIMISLAWIISFFLWAPAILLWPYIVEEQTAEKVKCTIQFLTEPVLTFGTAIAAFYLPVSIMIILYWRVYRETENRTRDLTGLLGLVDSRGASLDSRQQVPYSISAKSSISSSRETHAGESQGRERQNGCFPIRLARDRERNVLTSSLQRGRSNNGVWNLDEEEASDSSSSEAKGMSVMVVHVPMIRLRDMQGEVTGLEDRGVPRAGNSGSLGMIRQHKAKKRRSMIVKEKKAARTLSAILLAFILTWTPYNVMVLVSIFRCVPEKLWQLGYWLCYVNSTVNPMCYALCNKSFRVTFKMLLLLRWDKRKWGRPHDRATLRVHKSSSTV